MYKKIIVPVDPAGTSIGERILTKAKSLLDAGGEIVLLTIIEDIPGYLAIDVPVDLIEGAINGMLASLDPHSGYIEPVDYADVQEDTSGQFGGLGIEVGVESLDPDGAEVLLDDLRASGRYQRDVY